jgi:hypothetical protein
VGGWGTCVLSGRADVVCLYLNVWQKLGVIPIYNLLLLHICEVARILFVTVCTFWRVLFTFLVFTGKVVSSVFDTFWCESAKLSFMAKMLTSIALEWATQSSPVFYVYFEM